ncbi:hypothetical protein B0H15DRAFT_955798 [Mycena belliarum]|uniref:Uncharacterized protein n=1 Tax=Mycena belliarum TaxID=1033014 RepID=A0AAD6XMY9_9AGAR|nr:hypothetical protein B0H15DRAFT_955798 [Mycena belliae]
MATTFRDSRLRPAGCLRPRRQPHARALGRHTLRLRPEIAGLIPIKRSLTVYAKLSPAISSPTTLESTLAAPKFVARTFVPSVLALTALAVNTLLAAGSGGHTRAHRGLARGNAPHDNWCGGPPGRGWAKPQAQVETRTNLRLVIALITTMDADPVHTFLMEAHNLNS